MIKVKSMSYSMQKILEFLIKVIKRGLTDKLKKVQMHFFHL